MNLINASGKTDNPSCTSVKDIGPIPPDTYNITPNTLPNRAGWWGLQSQNWRPGIDGLLCRIGLKRCGFNIHLGTFSEGCLTFDKNDPVAVSSYMRINDLFLSDSSGNALTVVP